MNMRSKTVDSPERKTAVSSMNAGQARAMSLTYVGVSTSPSDRFFLGPNPINLFSFEIVSLASDATISSFPSATSPS